MNYNNNDSDSEEEVRQPSPIKKAIAIKPPTGRKGQNYDSSDDESTAVVARPGNDKRDNRGTYRDDDDSSDESSKHNKKHTKQSTTTNNNKKPQKSNNNNSSDDDSGHHEKSKTGQKNWASATQVPSPKKESSHNYNLKKPKSMADSDLDSDDNDDEKSHNYDPSSSSPSHTIQTLTPNKSILDILHSMDMREFLMTPIPKACGTVQCYITRNKSSILNMHPIYSIYLTEGNTFMMASRKRASNKTSNYLISMGKWSEL